MKAVTYSRYRPPDVLQLKDVEIPEPKDDEVLIKVHAVEVTKSDCEMRVLAGDRQSRTSRAGTAGGRGRQADASRGRLSCRWPSRGSLSGR